ncbi:TP53-regulated inhibitor of apoptosis 1-like [Octopus sinensis]|uniref:TP53-regulated inhibitor of apoptosis 1-like n=1 Tax=Octopus sinensis TaxID=2607531 RepID=A0A6P7TIQ0_9MOLL|nr:TP53-regulated inhibitor of apoptosis 1-like [Octopus sinensis]
MWRSATRSPPGCDQLTNMDSIAEECNSLKKFYDDCFNKWFSEKFLKGEMDEACTPMFKAYQTCITKAIKDRKIDIGELQQDVLGTEKEKPPPPRRG